MEEKQKVRSKTEEFKSYLQEALTKVLGVKVSKQKAWEAFKELEKAPFSFMLNNYDEAGAPTLEHGKKCPELSLSLAGIGTFRVITVGKPENFSVKGRFYLSSAMDRAIKEHLGFAADEEVEVAGDTDETGVAPADDLSDLDI